MTRPESPAPVSKQTPVAPSQLESDHTRKLLWCHGPERALAIVTGLDDGANEDIKAWRALGTGRLAR